MDTVMYVACIQFPPARDEGRTPIYVSVRS